MIRKGIKFRVSKSLGFEYSNGTQAYADGEIIPEHHLVIYRYRSSFAENDPIMKKNRYEFDKKHTDRERANGSMRTWYRKQVTMRGHSRTNMIYGKRTKRRRSDGKHKFQKVYWVEDAIVYSGSFHSPHCSCETTPCIACDGTGKQNVMVTTVSAEKGNSSEMVEMKCQRCRGKGYLTAIEQKQWEEYDALWCECGNPSEDVIPYADGENPNCHKHCYACKDCGKLLQVG